MRNSDPLRTVIVLDQRVSRARSVLQRTRETHPAFEKRVSSLVLLVSARDHALDHGAQGPLLPPAA